jgi:hypothetical protein
MAPIYWAWRNRWLYAGLVPIVTLTLLPTAIAALVSNVIGSENLAFLAFPALIGEFSLEIVVVLRGIAVTISIAHLFLVRRRVLRELA